MASSNRINNNGQRSIFSFNIGIFIAGESIRKNIQPKFPSVDEWIKMMSYIYIYIYTHTHTHTYTYIQREKCIPNMNDFPILCKVKRQTSPYITLPRPAEIMAPGK